MDAEPRPELHGGGQLEQQRKGQPPYWRQHADRRLSHRGQCAEHCPAYGDTSQFQGTYVSPAASSVASGVTYGPANTLTGTAILTAANVRAAVGMASANLDTQLANKATVDQVASIVQGATSA